MGEDGVWGEEKSVVKDAFGGETGESECEEGAFGRDTIVVKGLRAAARLGVWPRTGSGDAGRPGIGVRLWGYVGPNEL